MSRNILFFYYNFLYFIRNILKIERLCIKSWISEHRQAGLSGKLYAFLSKSLATDFRLLISRMVTHPRLERGTP